MRVRKAVFPAAGWGTRFLPATKAQPKEMLPLVDKPIIQYAVEEAVAAGIEQVIIVTSQPEAGDRGPLRPLLRARAPARGEGRHRDAPPGPRTSATWPRSRTSARRSSSAWATPCSWPRTSSATSRSRSSCPTTSSSATGRASASSSTPTRRRTARSSRSWRCPHEDTSRYGVIAAEPVGDGRSTTAASTASPASSRSPRPTTRRRTSRSSAGTS